MPAKQDAEERGAHGAARAASAESVLRARYKALWQDIQRELEKADAERYVDIVQAPGDPDDRAQADLLADVNLAEINRDVGELRDVQAALERIRHGTYGVCANCGEPIDDARLEVLPQARLCVACQARAEAGTGGTPSL